MCTTLLPNDFLISITDVIMKIFTKTFIDDARRTLHLYPFWNVFFLYLLVYILFCQEKKYWLSFKNVHLKVKNYMCNIFLQTYICITSKLVELNVVCTSRDDGWMSLMQLA